MLNSPRLLRRRRALARQSGFTLLELLVVLAILALLAGLVGPKVLEQLSGARADTAKIQIKNIEAALDLYRLDAGRYPSQSEGLQALIDKPAGVSKWRGPYLKSAEGLLDPWGERYRYNRESGKTSFEILSLGADKAEGGDGENADIRN